MLLGNIVERQASSSSSNPPPPPKPPSASLHAFPPVLHRSQRKSPFKSTVRGISRQQAPNQSVRPISPDAPESSSAPRRREQLSEVEEVRRLVDAENAQRVDSMTLDEREEEVRELKERFGPGLLGLMRKRREKRTSQQGEKDHANDLDANVNGQLVEPPGGDQGAGSEVDAVYRDVGAENERTVRGMSEQERAEEVRELEERFGSTVLDALRKRAERRKASSATGQIVPAQHGGSITSTKTHTSIPPAVHSASVRRESNLNVNPLSSHSREENLSAAEMKSKYFSDVPEETDKLAWLQPTSSSSTDTSPRFDLSGRSISAQESANLPSNLGLHHHGSSPDLAGYTLDDVLYLCQSTVPSQRITMMGLLAGIARNLNQEDNQLTPEARGLCNTKGVLAKGVEIGVSAIQIYSRSAGILRAGVELLFESLGGSTWGWMDEEANIVFDLKKDERGQPSMLPSLPWDDFAPSLSDLLDNRDTLSPRSLFQVIQILRRAAHHSERLCEIITPLLPLVVRFHVQQVSWPPISPSTNTPPPSLEGLKLLTAVIASSRSSAVAILDEGVIEPLLKFLITIQWGDNNQEITHHERVVYGVELALETLRILAALARYGLGASIAKTGREAVDQVQEWITNTPAGVPTYLRTEIINAYLDLLRNWVVCAIDPHRTTPEHSLTWAQVNALAWTDDVLSVLPTFINTAQWPEVASSLGYLATWLEGATINGTLKGEQEKEAVLQVLRDAKLSAVLQSAFEIKDSATSPAMEEALLHAIRIQAQTATLAAQALLLDLSFLKTLIEQYLLRPAAAYSSPALRYHLLQIGRGVIDEAQYAHLGFDLMGAFEAGYEAFALDQLDTLLRLDWAVLRPEFAASLSSLNGKDSIQILRPLLQCVILPDVTRIVAPVIPAHSYLKATATLRAPSRADPNVSSSLKRGPGLPLGADWFFSPLNELLQSGTSAALAQTPPDWDPSELDLVRATLLFAQMRLSLAPSDTVLSRSELILNLMKVYMLEHGQQTPTNTSETDVFRDSIVSSSLSSLLALTLTSGPLGAQSPTSIQPPMDLEKAAIPFLGPDMPFYQFYTDFLTLYEAISFSDPTFTQLLLTPLAMSYPVDYRKTFWTEHSAIVRGVRTAPSQVPIEDASSDSGSGLGRYFEPREEDPDVLGAFVRTLIKGWVREDTFLWNLVVWHLASLLWLGSDTRKESPRVNLLIGILGSAADAAVKAILGVELEVPADGVLRVVDEQQIQERKAIVQALVGERGSARLVRIGL